MRLDRTSLNRKTFGKLLVLRFLYSLDGMGFWECQCECGRVIPVASKSLKSGNTKSCGCLTPETHGRTKTPEYNIWSCMKQRCNNPKHPEYYMYGGRGIKVCERWGNFEVFLSDMGERPNTNYSIERLNNNKGYSPDNCKWATTEEQALNRRSNRHISVLGESGPLAKVARIFGVNPSNIRRGLERGLTPLDALMRAK